MALKGNWTKNSGDLTAAGDVFEWNSMKVELVGAYRTKWCW